MAIRVTLDPGGGRPMGPYQLEFYVDENGDEPVRRWLREDLSPNQRLVLGRAMNRVLQECGIDVCGTGFGKQLGRGLFEFRVRAVVSEYVEGLSSDSTDDKVLLRVFCHAHGDRLILLLGGYDKLANPSKGYQNDEIELARKRLRAWKLRQAKAARSRTPSGRP